MTPTAHPTPAPIARTELTASCTACTTTRIGCWGRTRTTVASRSAS